MSDWRKRNARTLLGVFREDGLARGIRLLDYAGENLRGEVFTPKEDLSGAVFRGADLTGARLAGVNLSGADLSDARLTGAVLDGADLTGADLTGAVLDEASLIGVELRDAAMGRVSCDRTKLTSARNANIDVLSGWGTAMPSEPPRLMLQPSATATSMTVWHPTRALLALANGNNAELWDPAAGTCLRTLTGHNDWLTSVAYSPDGTRLTTTSRDRTARIWNPATGTCLRTLTGHNASVTAVA
ncbi:WD40 repeat domain-containing protein, partial [Sphaerisporangium rubeum]